MPGTNRLVARQLKNGFTSQQVSAMGVLGKYAKAPANTDEKSSLTKLSISEKKTLNIEGIKPENKNLVNKFNKSKMECFKNFENVVQREEDNEKEPNAKEKEVSEANNFEKKEGNAFDKLRWNLQKIEKNNE
jgi:hypothetical protein